MTYSALILIIVLAGIGALATIFLGIVKALQRKWKFALLAAALSGLCFVFCLASLALLVGRIQMVVNSARQQPKVSAIQALTPGVDFSTVDLQYWTYSGDSDWYRIPIRYPYDVQSIDAMDYGSLEKNRAAGKSDGATPQFEHLDPTNITHYAVDSRMIAYRREDWTTHVASYGLFLFDVDKNQSFATEADMWTKAKNAGWTGVEALQSIKRQYEQYWGN